MKYSEILQLHLQNHITAILCKIQFTYLLIQNYGIQYVLSDFTNLTQVHNFTVSAHDIFTIRRLSIFTVSFTGILQFLMQIMKRFVLSY